MTRYDIDKLHNLLARMREEDPDFRVFGAGSHQYCLGPLLSEEELQAFERQYSVMLPEDFRFFLKEIGNGGPAFPYPYAGFGFRTGAGPSYGVKPLEKAVLGCDLSRPFPLTEAVEIQPYLGIERWGDEEEYPGVLEICHHGCAFFSYLVVKGPASGTVWSADVDLRRFERSHPSFESWYGQWMSRLAEHALPRIANERKIAGVEVGMTKDEIIAICGGEWTQRRWGENTFLSFSHLSTNFELNKAEVVVRVIASHISC